MGWDVGHCKNLSYGALDPQVGLTPENHHLVPCWVTSSV